MGQKRKSGVKWYHSILFQVIAVNIVMSVVFLAVMITTMDSLDNSVNMSSELMTYIASANNYEGKVSSKVYYLYSQPFVYIYASKDSKDQIKVDVEQNTASLKE